MAGGDVDIRVAADDDWPQVLAAYRAHYRDGHPLADRQFWRWRFGDPATGLCLVAVAGHQVVGHLGVIPDGEVAWVINLFVLPEHRGTGLPARLYDVASAHGTLVTTNVNRAGTDMYRRFGWYRQADLVRFVAWNPDVPHDEIVAPRPLLADWPAVADDHHYWRQPGLRGLTAPDGSLVVEQLEVGGLRAVTVADPAALPGLAREAGAAWIDYLTSWNDPLCRDIDRIGWAPDRLGPVPWLLSPLIPGSRAEVNVFSQKPFDPRRIIRRWDSDHGRVGSRGLDGPT